MSYAEVSVNSPVAQKRTFSYTVPHGMDCRAGQAVLVPFGERTLQGIVMELTDIPSVEETRDIISVLGEAPLVSRERLALAQWISSCYHSPLFDAVSLMLPPGFERRTLVKLSRLKQDCEAGTLSEIEKAILENFDQGTSDYRELEKRWGQKKTSATVSGLVRRGIISRTYSLASVRVKPKIETFIFPVESASCTKALTERQQRLFDYVTGHAPSVTWSEARAETETDTAVLRALQNKGLITAEGREVSRDPLSGRQVTYSSPPLLTSYQQSAVQIINAALQKPSPLQNVFLLHGVTGSGKTEVYLQTLAEALRLGKKGIVLVPEIALTPQTIERFSSRFPGRVAVLHSGLSLGEQYDEWRRISDGDFDVVIGPRSALFSPQPELGIIILDEEHEWTYKQDTSPRYHARDAAIKLAELTGAVVVLGSATPSLESYFKAESGDYRLLELPERISAAGGRMPKVDIIDMRDELKAGNRSIFSRELTHAVNKTVAAGEQVILFLNRRGGSTFIQCRKCGFVLRCKKCEVPLSHHITGDVLLCHQCGTRSGLPSACPQCNSRQLKYLGTGTQKLEQEVRFAFPRARHLRWDSDTSGKNSSPEEMMAKMKNGEVDILIGTQMIAKGLDIPGVTLVGVMNADTALNLPDFRAGERTFQVLSQVAGRAGRGANEGRVIIQTFTPEHYAVRAASGHDYQVFFEQELDYRRVLRNPPFSQLARLIYSHASDEACGRESVKMRNMITATIDEQGRAGIEIIGPAPVFIHRLRGRYRWHIILRGNSLSKFLNNIDIPRGWTVDIDPVTLLQ